MEKKILYVGLDVDDTAFHGCALISKAARSLNSAAAPTSMAW